MTSASSLLERELLGSARTIIDAHSNTPFSQQNTYRTPYGTTYPVPYTASTIPYTASSIPYPTATIPYTTNYRQCGCGNDSTDNYESKKALNDVKIVLIFF